MAVKTVVDVEVNDETFKRFKELFDKYQEALAKSPGIWKDVNDHVDVLAKKLDAITDAIKAQTAAAKENDEPEEKRFARLRQSESLWTSIAKSSAALASNAISISAHVIKWGSILGGGLLGGSLFGLDRLGAAASDQRRSSTGLGLSVGEQKAFDVNLGRFVNPNAFLGGINKAVSDISQQGPLYALGVNPNQSTADVAIATLRAVRARAMGTSENQLGLLGSMYHLDQLGLGVEDIRRLRKASPSEFEGQMSHYRTDVGSLNVADKTGQAWQNFTSQMERAGQTIEKIFINGLVPLAGPLEHLSAAVVKTLSNIMAKDGVMSQGIDALARWIENFSVKVASDKFQQAISKFMMGLTDLADLIHTIAHPYDTARDWTSRRIEKDVDEQSSFFSSVADWLSPNRSSVTSSKSAYRDYLARKDWASGLPSNFLESVWNTESGSNMYPPNSSKGAIGAFQFMPATAKQYGVNPSDPVSSANGAARYFHDLDMKYGGDITKALAAYNWGPGNVDAVLADKSKSKDWFLYTPLETQNYVIKTGATIQINDNTGGSVVLAGSALNQ